VVNHESTGARPRRSHDEAEARLTAAIVAVALALPGVSSAAQTPPPTQDSVVISDAIAFPEGENPMGAFTIDLCGVDPAECEGGGIFRIDGAVSCLDVSGNKAIIGTQPSGGFGIFGLWIAVADNGTPGAGRDAIGMSGFQLAPVPTSPPCTEQPAGAGFVSPEGEITVIDAQPLPTSKDQCKNGGWQQLGFGTQGQCVAFVEAGRKP
jgi:hypothetical protein